MLLSAHFEGSDTISNLVSGSSNLFKSLNQTQQILNQYQNQIINHDRALHKRRDLSDNHDFESRDTY